MLQSEIQGDIIINNIKSNDIDYLDLDIIFIGDNPVFFNNLTMQEQMLLVAQLQNIKKEECKRLIDEMTEYFKVKKYLNYYPNACSRGTLQRFTIISGYLTSTTNLLLDEPFITLDPLQVRLLEKFIINQGEEKTTIISSHDLESLKNVCDEYLIINNNTINSYSKDEINKQDILKLLGESYDESFN